VEDLGTGAAGADAGQAGGHQPRQAGLLVNKQVRKPRKTAHGAPGARG
jgi:hypothetical protein